MIESVVFDFNGTMVFDGKYHEEAWKIYISKLLHRELSLHEFQNYILGRINVDIFQHFLGEQNRKLTSEEILNYSEEKEATYRELFQKSDDFHLTDGLSEFLDILKGRNVKINIATASNQANVDFYFQVFGLERWFDKALVAYDDGTVKGKPEPDLYINAMKNIGADPATTLVFEDGRSGVIAASRAGVRTIIGIYGDSNRVLLEETGFCKDYIQDYRRGKDVITKCFF